MRHGSHAETPTVFEVVQRAVAVCDPDGDDELIADLLRLAARAEYGDEPPVEIRDWLRDVGVAV